MVMPRESNIYIYIYDNEMHVICQVNDNALHVNCEENVSRSQL